MRQSPQTSYPSSATSSTVRRIFMIPMGMPVLTSSSESAVRMISAGDEVDKDIVILDSGSDVSLLPLSYGQCGMDAVRQEEVQLRDCHGSHLKVTGYRTVSLVVRDGDGTEAELEHAFLIANVKSCILSLGQLYRNGWCVKQMDDGSGPYLESPDKGLHIPVFYERNSLAMKATVCRVEQVGDEVQLSPHVCVRAVVELKNKFRPENPRNNVWQVADGHPYLRCISTNYVNPRPAWAANFGYRTTLVQKRSTASEDHGWNVVEVSAKYLELENPFGPIADLAGFADGEDVVVLTILSEKEEALASFGDLLDAGGYFDLPYEPESPMRGEGDGDGQNIEGLEIDPILDVGRDDEVMGRDIPEHQAIAPALREDAEADMIVINDIQVTPNSSVEVLKTAGRFLGISTADSKNKIFERIRASHVSSLRLRALEVARGEYEALQPHPQYQDAPAQPTLRERKLHEVTHLPFKKWCSVCVQSKSRPNHQRSTLPDELAQRSFPTIQCDFYTVSGNLNVLIMVDAWTKFIAVEPSRNKLQSVVGGAVARFLGELGCYDQVELAFDNEPVLAAGMRSAQTIRAAQGLPTVLQPGQLYGKGRTSLAERSIQTVRAQGKCLMTHLEDKMRVKFPSEHPLRAWAVIHGAWLLNRYHVASSTGTTAFMSLCGRPYKGRICAFGEEVFALDPLQAKYSTQWRRGIWLTKDGMDMDVVAVSENEVIRSRAIRKVAEHWNAELALSLKVGPWDMRRGVYTEMKFAKPPESPLPLSHVPVGGVEPEFDDDEKGVMKYAKENPMEDLEDMAEEVEISKTGGAGGAGGASASVPVAMQSEADQGGADLGALAQSKRSGGDVRLPIPVRQRIAEAEATKREQQDGEDVPAKFVKFDPESAITEPSPKQPRTTLYSPVYAGELATSPATSSTSRHVRRIVEDIELYDEDELECGFSGDPDLEFGEPQPEFAGERVEISEEEKKRRGFFNEGAGPPTVTEDELAWLDQEAMHAELKRLKNLDVIEDISDGAIAEECVKLDTRLVRDWRF